MASILAADSVSQTDKGWIWPPHQGSFYFVKNIYNNSEMLPFTEIYQSQNNFSKYN
jgi:hypothetical protein